MTGIGGHTVHALEACDRRSLLEILGLADFAFHFQERVGNQVLRSWQVQGARCIAAFPLPMEIIESDRPLLVRTHLSHTLAERPFVSNASLWEELLPFPFHLWGDPPGAEASGGTESTDPAWLEAGRSLRNGFSRLEARLHSAEISVLRFASESAHLELFFHCVRKRFVRSGRLETVEDSAADFGHLAASFQTLTVQTGPAKPTLPEQVRAIEAAIGAALDSASAPHLEGPATQAMQPLPL